MRYDNADDLQDYPVEDNVVVSKLFALTFGVDFVYQHANHLLLQSHIIKKDGTSTIRTCTDLLIKL